MVDEPEDLMVDEEGAPTSSPGEAVCLTNNICTKAVAEVSITIVVAVATIAKVEDRQLTHNTITTMNQQIRETMIKLETAIILTMKVVHLHRNGD